MLDGLERLEVVSLCIVLGLGLDGLRSGLGL